MKNFLVSSVAPLTMVAILALATPALSATANAAPTGQTSVDSTIENLHAQGFEVIVNRTEHDASKQCAISAVRPGQTFSRTDSGAPGAHSDLVTTVIGKTVYVDITC
jgi:hypothetical protein